MFTSDSRYAKLDSMILTIKNEPAKRYVSRRFLPSSEDASILQTITVISNDRIDLITSRTLGDPQQFWKICDANNAMHPLDLTISPGRTLNIPIPWK